MSIILTGSSITTNTGIVDITDTTATPLTINRSGSDVNINLKFAGASITGYLGIDSTGTLKYHSTNADLATVGYKIWHAGNDGPGSTLDADTVDGLQASQFIRNDQSASKTGALTISDGGTGSLTINKLLTTDYSGIKWNTNGVEKWLFYTLNDGSEDMIMRSGNSTEGYVNFMNIPYRSSNVKFYNTPNVNGSSIWHAGNDGAGSGLDADKLDGVHGSSFVRSDVDSIKTGALNINKNIGTALYNEGGNGWQDGYYHLSLENSDAGDVVLNFHRSGYTNISLSHYNSGELFLDGSFRASGNVTAYSDIRVKTNLEKISNAVDKVLKLSGYTFNRTDVTYSESGEPNIPERQTGVIAQEVLCVLPEAVIGSEDHGYSVAYGNMVGLLIEAIKEQQEQINDMKKEITILKGI